MAQPAFSYEHPATGRTLTLAIHAAEETLSSSLARVRTYEPGVSSLIVQALSEGDVMIDVGANIGWHTLLAAEKVGPQGHVYAIEPDPTNFSLLTANCAGNGLTWADCIKAAASDRSGDELLHLSATNFGDHRLYEVADETRRTSPVQVVRLDDALGGRLDRLRLVKIDTQGYEPKVLRGMSGIIERWRPVVAMEFWPHGILAGGESIYDVLAFIERFSYQPHLITPAGLQLTTPGVLLELSRSLLSPDSQQFVDIALLQLSDRDRLRGAKK